MTQNHQKLGRPQLYCHLTACTAKNYNLGWIANTLLEIFDEADLSLDQWLAIASATEKPKAWAFKRAEENGKL